MEQQRRHEDHQHRTGGGGNDPAGGQNIDRVNRLLAASDGAIREALSGDAETFVEAVKQQGGQ